MLNLIGIDGHINNCMASNRQVVSVSVDGIVNSTAFLCNVTYENHLTQCRVLVEKAEEDPIPTNFQTLKHMVEEAQGNLSEVCLDGCIHYMHDSNGFDKTGAIL